MSQTMKQEKNSTNLEAELTRDRLTYIPNVDILENDHEILMFADMPGVEQGNLDLHFENRQLAVHGRVNPREDQSFIRKEYGLGDYYRTFTIGDSIDSTRISAELINGVLTVRLPKQEAVKSRKIKVNFG